MHQINLPRSVRIGGGVLGQAAEALKQFGLSRPLVVTDAFLMEAGFVARLLDILDADGIDAAVFDGVLPDPTLGVVAAATDQLKAGNHDCVIGFGGGSPIDTAKAVAVLGAKGGDAASFKAPAVTDDPGLPIIAIPTTAGTGSEATRVTVLTNEATSEKMLCMGLAFLPTIAIVDYELTLDKPLRLTADTGIDSLTHAIEAYVSRRANAFSDAMALSAMKLIADNIRTVCTSPHDRNAREAMAVGAHHAGIAFSNASVALVHGMSRPIGAFFHVPHGLSNAMLLPVVTAFSAPAALGRYAMCARTMGVADANVGDQSAVAALVAELEALNAELSVPTPKAFGIDRDRYLDLVPEMVSQAIGSGSPANNPREPSADEIASIYRQVYG